MEKKKSSFYGIGENMTGYVYYQSLLYPNNPANGADKLRQFSVDSVLRYEKKEPALNNSIGETLLQQSAAEYQKEIHWLSAIFNVPVSLSQEENWDIEIVNALNMCLSLKEQLKRTLARYEAGDLKNTDYFTFGKYMSDAWAAHINELYEAVDPDLSTEQIVDKWEDITKNVIIPDAIKKFSEIGINYNFNDPNKDIGSWEEFYTKLLQFKNSKNILIQELYQEYKLDDLLNDIKQSPFKWDSTKFKEGIIFSEANHLQGGTIHEIFETAIAEYIMNGLQSDGPFSATKNFDNKAWHSGGVKIKDDIMLSWGLNYKHIEKFLKTASTSATSRINNVNAMRQLDNTLRNVQNGYLVHVNAKDYSKKTYRNSGFQGEGKTFTLGALRHINLYNHNNTSNTINLIGAICQTLHGAILQDEKEVLVDALASQIAQFLFDDILNLGKEMEELKGVRGHEIHLFLLNGLYVPLSVLLYKLGLAYKNAGDIKEWANVEVILANHGNILYTEEERKTINMLKKASKPTKEEWEDIWTSGMWNTQRNTVLNQSKIKVHFMKGVDEIFDKISVN